MLLAPAPTAPSSSSSSPSPSFPVSVAADGSEAMAKDDDDSSANVFATLMPNLFKKLQQSDDTITEKGFHDIDRLLNEVTTEEQEAYGNSIMKKPQKTFLNLKANENDTDFKEKDHTTKKSPLLKRVYASDKENMLPAKICHRNRHSRRERSSRVTSHRRAFVVNLKSLGSVSNDQGFDACKMPQDVHAFWEAADEREAAEAIMTKLRGGSQMSSQTVSGNSRRLGVRRQNSRRLATRLKGFSVDLLSCAEQMQSLDKEQLEEEDYGTEESSFTFLSNTDFRVDKGICESQTSVDHSVISELSPVQSYRVTLDIPETDEVMDLEHETMSDGKSPFSGFKTHDECNSSQTRTADSVVGWDKFITSSQVQEVVEVGLSQPVNSPIDESDYMHVEREVTPCYRNPMSKRTPITSPTPPSNPLAGLVFRRDSNTMESIGKRRLEADFAETMDSSVQQFEMSHIDSPLQGTDFPAVDSSIQEVDLPTINSIEDIEMPAQTGQSTPLLQDVPDMVMFPENHSQERTFHNMEEMNFSVATEATDFVSNPDENKKKRPKTDRSKTKRVLTDRRDSLDGAGTNWNEGVRRSTRVRSRPLEWWRGERFLRGRVHKSLATVIGIKYSSPPPACWSKRNTKPPNFKVESYVSEEYSKYVNFAALY